MFKWTFLKRHVASHLPCVLEDYVHSVLWERAQLLAVVGVLYLGVHIWVAGCGESDKFGTCRCLVANSKGSPAKFKWSTTSRFPAMSYLWLVRLLDAIFVGMFTYFVSRGWQLASPLDACIFHSGFLCPIDWYCTVLQNSKCLQWLWR